MDQHIFVCLVETFQLYFYRIIAFFHTALTPDWEHTTTRISLPDCFSSFNYLLEYSATAY